MCGEQGRSQEIWIDQMEDISRREFLEFLNTTAAYATLNSAFVSVPAQGISYLEDKKDYDAYWSKPHGTYERRRSLYLKYCASQSPGGRNGFFSQIARLELGREHVDAGPIREAIEYVYSGQDCNDFAIAGLLRLLYLYRDSPLIASDLISEIEASILRFKYWWDEPGKDRRCYHTENHQVIFHSDELLAGQLFKDKIFQNNGRDGKYHIDHALPLIRRWMDFRVKFGFSEWLSNCYFEEDLLASVNLYDFSEDPVIRRRAEMLIDVILLEMALHSYRGVFGCTHGRTYARLIKGGRDESSASTAKLMLGMGVFNKPDALGTIPLATSRYRCPPIIEEIAADCHRSILCKERHSINIVDAPEYGLSYENELDGHLYWSIQDYAHPKVIELSQRISKTYGVRQHENYQKYLDHYQAQVNEHGRIIDPDLDYHALTEVNIETFRTSNYLLSCAQDYRAGKPGYQQHIWQATMGIDAVIFTNHPGSDNETSRPNYWAGNGIMPRAAQHRNVLVCIHHVPPQDPFPLSHAYFPKIAFDEVVKKGHWICARKADGYLALYSQNTTRWLQDKEGNNNELRVDSPDNIWLCETGTKAEWRTFSRFVNAVTSAQIKCEGLRLDYRSPSLGSVHFGWSGPLRVDGRELPLKEYKRFDNPYCQSEFTASQVLIKHGNQELSLDFDQNARTMRTHD
jgi:hypothetical protein